MPVLELCWQYFQGGSNPARGTYVARGEILSLSKICTHAKLFANLTTRFADSLPARKY